MIAYRDLKTTIIDPGFCTLCGACEAACPVRALKIEQDELRYLFDCAEQVEFCPICYDVCPHTESLLVEASSFVTDAPYKGRSLGYYRKALLAQAVDPKLRELSRGGSVVMAVLADGIQKNSIDSAIVSRAKEKGTLDIKSSIGLVPDDIFSAVDMEFFRSAAGEAFGKAVNEHGKSRIAFVGTPCQVLAVRKLESWEHKIMDSLKVVIGLMCLWSFSLPQLLKAIKEDYGIEPPEIEKVSLDKRYFVHTKDRVTMIPVTEAKKHTLETCQTCTDYTSDLADISVGGAYPLEDWSIVIVRTKNGEEMVESAVKHGAIRTRNLEEEPEVFAHFIEMSNLKRRIDLEDIKKAKAAGTPVPPARLRLLEPTPKELRFLSSLSVRETMTSEVVTVSPETKIGKLLEIMIECHHLVYPILDENKDLVGIATFKDVMQVPPDERGNMSVGDIEQKELVTVYADDTALVAYERMLKQGVERILVVDRKNPRKLSGIVTETDMTHALRWPMKRK